MPVGVNAVVYFQIEKAAELETDYLIREVRKFLAEKFSNYMRFVEALLNPTESSIFIFSIIKTLDSGDKKILSEIYKKLTKIEISLFELDLEYNEEKEAEFIKSSYIKWKEIKKDLFHIVHSINCNLDNSCEKKGSSYLG